MLGSDRPPAELGQFTGFLLNWLGARSRERFMTVLEPHGLHPRDFGVMVVLGSRPGVTQHELADSSEVDRSSLVAVLDGLEARGLAERRAHAEDRRKRAVHLTAKGEATLATLQGEARDVGRELLDPLDAGERKELQRLLRKLARMDEPARPG